MVAYLARIVGLGRLDLAEDVVQDTLIRAIELWPVSGLPDNPSAWLMRVARNRAIDLLRRDEQFRFFAPELTHLLKLREELPPDSAAFAKEIEDDELRMMFALCHPELSADVQVTLILKTLCAFSVAEIAHALFANPDSIEKRLGRARVLFRQSAFEPDPTNVAERLDAVQQAIYLLFNEGYHGSGAEATVREELCFEAIRLAMLVSEHPEGDRPKSHALVALLCFHAARLPGRIDDDGNLIQLPMQDRSQWDRELMARGFAAFERSAAGDEISEYHVEAAIASVHCAAATYEETDWNRIVDLYDLLYRMRPTPIVALNRAIAIGNARGAEEGLLAMSAIEDSERLASYPFFPAAQAELHLRAGRSDMASVLFARASELARTKAEAEYFNKRALARE